MNTNAKPDIYEMILTSLREPTTAVSARPSTGQAPDDWHEDHEEGQLSVDVVDRGKEIVVISTMAGAIADKVEVYIHNDLLTVRGERVRPIDAMSEEKYLFQECFWGKFSRTIVLPVEVKGDSSRAEYRNGVLSIIIPKRKGDARIPITIVEE